MRLPYKPPEITLLGSVTELTQSDLLAPGADNLGAVLGGNDGSGDMFS